MKKGKRIASVVLVLAMLLSMFTVVNAADSAPFTALWFLEPNGYPKGGSVISWNFNLVNTDNTNETIVGAVDIDSIGGRDLPLTDEEKTAYTENGTPKQGLQFVLDKDTYNTNKKNVAFHLTLNDGYKVLPMFAWETARFEVDVWSTSGESANYPTAFYGQFYAKDRDEWINPSIQIDNSDVQARTWKHISVPLKEIIKTRCDNAITNYIGLYMPSSVTEDCKIFFRNFRLIYDPGVTVSALGSASGKKVTLSLTPYGGLNADSYDIYRDGKLIAGNVTETTYIDATTVANTEYTYTVKAKLNGEVIATSETTVTTNGLAKKTFFTYLVGNGWMREEAIYFDWNVGPLGIVKKDSTDYTKNYIVRGKVVENIPKENYGSGTALNIKAGDLKDGGKFGLSLKDYRDLPCDRWNDAYLAFDIYSDTGKNYPTSATMQLFNKNATRENDQFMSVDAAITKTDYNTAEWNRVEIPLNGFVKQHDNMLLWSFALIFDESNDASKIYLRNMQIVYTPSISVKTESIGKNVSLTITPDSEINAESYRISRDGVVVANITDTMYMDVISEIGHNYTYKVEAMIDGDAVAKCEKTIFAYPANRVKGENIDFVNSTLNSKFSVVGFTNNVAIPTLSETAPQTGGFSWKWNYDINNEKLTNITAVDLAQQYRFAADSEIAIQPGQNLELMIYTDAESKDKLPKGISVFYNNDENSYGIWDLKDRIELGKWNYISIPASKLGVTEDDIDGRIINRIEILSDSLAGAEKSFNVYVANMGISQEDLSVTANISDSEIIVNCSSTVDGSYKLFKNNSETPLFERTQSEFDVDGSYIETITEYGVTNKYILNRYDENGNLSSSAECSVKVDAPAEGIILAVVGNEPVNECSASDNVTVRAYPAKGSAESFVVMAATYAADGSLLKAENVTDGSFVPTTAGNVKFMILDSMANLVPLANAKTLIVK